MYSQDEQSLVGMYRRMSPEQQMIHMGTFAAAVTRNEEEQARNAPVRPVLRLVTVTGRFAGDDASSELRSHAS